MITLSSDFGSPYPAAMKGVILQQTDTRLVDVSHEFPRQDVRAAAFWLREVLPYFPPAVHLVVVDPGVGTDRKAIAVRAGDHLLVGPDNGVLLPVARRLAADFSVFELDAGRPKSTTFHGRDVFAPWAAKLHDVGVESIDDLPGVTRTDAYVNERFPEPTITDDGATGEVLVVDDFGNVITNIPGHVLDGRKMVTVNDQPIPIGETFAAVGMGAKVVTVGSHENVELAVNQGRGDEAFALGPGDDVTLSW
ncbi:MULTISPECIES: S-adenosyl-l-methionine hydroxide adenosyltransferase family protein [unclassified Haladaptatus]|uniref:SAM hydrolase/SAM-dependent halogenase family protein n=1 Tax=unclassified Haladaptatus TaxID=2622732 RepID=UPI0023E87A2E|nr:MULTISPECIES: SAM-dependent chlorinase/fluorinase [unclassified Haladaptatus]